jgi:hypothetical protein
MLLIMPMINGTAGKTIKSIGVSASFFKGIDLCGATKWDNFGQYHS